MLPLKEYLKKPRMTAFVFVKRYGKWLPDKLYLKIVFWLQMGYSLNLKRPTSFSEKLQWLKIYDRKPEYTKMVDKYAVKEYVAGIIGEEFIIPTLGVWNNTTDVEWEKLPNQFVIKTTHGGGNTGVVICKDKNSFDKNKAIRKLEISMGEDLYKIQREWPYKNVPHRIMAEKYIEPSPDTKDLPDYKFFCFNGEPKYCQVVSGRSTKMCVDFFDKDWIHQPFHEPQLFPFADIEPARPRRYEIMWDLARKLAQGKVFSRIDFYEVGDAIYFGEITFFPTSGYGGFEPSNFDIILGQMINLPDIKHYGA